MMRLPLSDGGSYELHPSKIIAVGLNYHAHVAEADRVKVFDSDTPFEPVLFAKTPNVLIPHDESIVLPRIVDRYGFEEPRVDYEAELAIVIGRRCKHVPRDEAHGCILGVTCFNDVSQRNIQRSDKSGWFRGKSFDTFGPIGPILVRFSEIPDIQELHIACRLNGSVVQEANTSEMIFAVDELIAFISANFTLEVGDIIATGTPAGVGALREGDLVEVEIERIGVLRNGVRREGP